MIDRSVLQSTYISALQFENVANQQLKLCGTTKEHPPVQQFVVNITFSIELFLKCLIMIESQKKAPHKHELDFLYNQLSVQSKQIIKKSFDKKINESLTLKAAKNSGVIFNADLNNVLRDIKNAFVEWRYMSIDGMPKRSIIGTSQLTSSIKERINELHQF